MQKQAWRKMKKTALVLSAVMFVTCAGGAYTPNAEAATKAPTLSATSFSLKKGQTKKITIKTSKKEKIKKTTWTVNNKKLKVVKKTNKSLTVKALKTGNVSISVKIKTNKKTYTKKVKVAVAAKNTPKPDTTKKPDPTEAPNKTPEPGNTGSPDSPSNPDNPTLSEAPADTEKPTDTEAPADTEAPDVTEAPANTNAPAVQKPASPEVPEELIQGTVAAKASWHDGKLADISGIYSGKKLRFTVKVREQGVTSPTGTMKIKSNYNTSYPTLASFDLSTEWQTITFEYRFNDFTTQYACLYFDDEKGDTSGDLNMYYRDFNIEVIDQGDDLGGTSIAKNEFNMITVSSLRSGSTNPHKFYENKQVHVSFSIRERGVADPTGVTLNLQAALGEGNYPTVKSGISLGTAWTDVEFDYSFGEITNTWPSLYFNYTDALADMELFMKDFSIRVTGEAEPTPTPEVTEAPAAGETETITINKTATIAAGKAAWGGNVDVAFDTPIALKLSDTVKAKIKVCFDGEEEEQTTYGMQLGFYTNDLDTWSSRCYMTTGFVSGTLKELSKTEAPEVTEDKTIKGFKVQNQSAIPDGKDIKVTLVELQITHSADAPAEPTPTPFATVELKGAGQYAELGKVTYTVGDDVPTAFHIEFNATEGANVNLTISANGKECNYGVGNARTKDCDLTFSQWGDKGAIGTLSTGDEVTIIASAGEANKVDSFEFTKITPKEDSTVLTDVDLTGVAKYTYNGTARGFTPVLKTDPIAPDATGKTLADYSKVVIEFEESNDDPAQKLNFSIINKDDNKDTDAFVTYDKKNSDGTTKIEIQLKSGQDGFNEPGEYQTVYDDLAAALAIDASKALLKVTAKSAGYKGTIIIRSVQLVEKE